MLDTGQVKHFEKNHPIHCVFLKRIFVSSEKYFHVLDLGITTHSSVFRMRSVSGDGIRGMTRCNIPSKT